MAFFKNPLITSDPLLGGVGAAVPKSAGLYVASGTFSGSVVSGPLDVLTKENYSVVVVVTGSVTGTAYVQESSYYGPIDTIDPNTWVTASYQAMTAPAVAHFNLSHRGASFMRFGWLHTAGTGSIDVSATGKGE